MESGIAPFALAFLAAVCSNKQAVGIIWVILGLGTWVGLGKEGLLIYVLTSLVFITFSLIYRPKYENTVRNEKRKLGAHLVISTFLVQAMGILFKTFYVYDLLTSILFTIVTYIFYKIFCNSIPVVYEFGKKKAFTIEEVIGSSLLISIAISALGNFTIFGFNIKNILCILIVLVLGWKNGVLVGTTGGVTIGVVLGIIGKGDPILLASFALSGMIAGILNHFGKIGVIAGFILGNAILTYTATGNLVEVIYFREILIASLGLLIIPKNVEINISDLVGKTKFLASGKEKMLEENDETVYKLNSVSETISEIAKSYHEAAATVVDETKQADKNKEIFLDEFLNNLEGESQNMLYDDIVNPDTRIAEDIYEKIMEKDEIYMQDIIDIFEKHDCYILGMDDKDIRSRVENDIQTVAKIANQTLKISKLNFVWKQKVEESKKTIGKSLDGVSQVIAGVAESIGQRNQNEEQEKQKEEIEILLLQKGIGLYDMELYKEESGRTVANIYTKICEDMTEEVNKIQKIEGILNKVLKEKMVMHNQKNGIGGESSKVLQTYISEDKFKLEIGIAKEKKMNSEVSGDTSLKLKLADGKMLIALSDGMGSGKEAQKSSSTATKMVKKLFSSGFDKKVALELTNQVLKAQTEAESFATLDISIFDLFSGNAEIIKSGACPTYIKNGRSVQIIKGNSLPAGMLNKIDTVIFDRDLKPGDIFIICSDGILDANIEAINKEEELENLIANITTDKVQKIADIILKESIDKGFGTRKDDMTVIVAKVS